MRILLRCVSGLLEHINKILLILGYYVFIPQPFNGGCFPCWISFTSTPAELSGVGHVFLAFSSNRKHNCCWQRRTQELWTHCQGFVSVFPFLTCVDSVLGIPRDLPCQVVEFSKDAFAYSSVCRHYSKRSYSDIQYKAKWEGSFTVEGFLSTYDQL